MLKPPRLKCSFCGKSQDQVKKLIAGPGVYICDECVELCNEILDEEVFETDSNRRAFIKENPDIQVAFTTATIGAMMNMSHKAWRRPPCVPPLEGEQRNLVQNAASALEAVIESWRSEDLNGGLEPLFRALLVLKETENGTGTKKLVPLLVEMADLYEKHEEHCLAAGVLEWAIEILERAGDEPEMVRDLKLAFLEHLMRNDPRRAINYLNEMRRAESKAIDAKHPGDTE